ncbi:glycoside hydrolase family 2 protein [Rubellicoccus peritrichatus]|uniref:Beta-glucuronidase n=1 Tax=Rubellicoccus peritrichatus TaxID=3080537 RepID=A0AAQ3L9H9_9BACT|nr:glycoside hydrolase family 2 TIM barrel-domain containing protein [Puniceicoccus sp. CR14]WOO41321.1 glycoside hydrolase family 2 TIM barrel-domain containing protein [Puniceicoccus sp. CR14]
MKPFPHYSKRQVDELDGLWDFAFFEGESLLDVEVANICFKKRTPVPAAFDTLPDQRAKRGTAAYRRILQIAPNSRSLLEFGAVSFTCRILIDGVCLKEHFCGYSPFEVELPVSDKRERELIVLADNRFDFERTPMHEAFFDFYQFGGIIRQVFLHHLPGNAIMDVHVDVQDLGNRLVKVAGRLDGQGVQDKEITITSLDINAESATAIADESGCFETTLSLGDAELWSPDSPALYCLHLCCGEDDMIVRFGFREVKTEGCKLLLNGEPVRLLGYNRHEYFPNYGPSTPYSQMVADIQILKDTGCNFVRGSHYPQDQHFLDLCDELGMLVWEEALGWGQREKQLTDKRFQEHHRVSLEEMVARSYNHPSIIIWGFLNEASSDEEFARPIFEESISYLRSAGGNRLVSYASMFPDKDLYFGLCDVVSINMYPGWYGCEDHPDPLSLIVPHIRAQIEKLAAAGLDDRPFLISEIGCEGLRGWHDEQRDFHSEEYQHDYLKLVCEEAVANQNLLGVCLWHFSDAKTYAGGRALMRPRAFNNKGTFDEYRRPKLGRDAVRSAFIKSQS